MGTARCWIELAVVVLAVPLLVWIPGLLAALHLSFLDPEERAAVAGSFGLALVGASAFVAHVSPAPPAVVNAVVWTVAVVLGLVSARAARRPLRTAVSWPRLGWWALFYLALVGLQGMSPIYAGGNWYGDWWEHYSIAQAYAGTAGGRSSTWFAYYNLASRTPLFNLGAAFCLSLFGDRFWVYQVFSTALSSLFVLPLHLLTRELMGRRAALLAAVFVFFDTWLVHDAMFTWSKMTTAYLLLLALHFHLRLRGGAGAPALYLATWCGALAVMAHQSAAYYLAGLALSHGLLRPRPATTPRQASVAAAIAAVVVVPWHWWVSRLFGVTGVVRANPVLSTGRPTVGRLLGGGVENAVTSLVPVPLVDFLLGGRLGGDKVLFRLVQFYFNPLAGALTVSLMVALVCAWWMRPSPALGQGFHRLKGPWLALVFGSLIVAALLVARPRYAHAWYGPGPFVWMLGAGLVALGLWTLWRRPTELPPGDARHLEAALFALFGYWGGLLAHPGGEIDGVASNAMVPSVLLVIAYALGRVATLPIRGQGLFLAGVMAEFAAMWALLGNLIAGAMPFVLDTNHALKAQNRLVFIYDLVGGRWVPFALLTLAAQAGALATALLDPARRARRAPGQPVAQPGSQRVEPDDHA